MNQGSREEKFVHIEYVLMKYREGGADEREGRMNQGWFQKRIR